jgi:predicted phosphodiesterase
MASNITCARVELDATVTRLVALGDPHGDLAGVEAILAAEDGPGVAWLCVGDVVGRADGPSCSRLALWLRDRGVHTVEGNHDAWSTPRGEVAIPGDASGDMALDPEAVAWLAELPAEMEVFHPAHGGRVAAMVHAYRDPRYRDVDAHNARELVDQLGGPRVVLVGHTHYPRILRLGRRADRAEVESLDFLHFQEISAEIPERDTLILDAGSVADPRYGDVSGAERRAYASYAVVDLAAGTASVRSLRKP